ncbi:hypothetical protein PHYBOEH_004873 [Phytophthora boehmeriae]|uniref:Carbohydrate kinase FGGY N-terminal domain-containing protein n=1 Tax=Phytophthora boehmeriae TaxID=109152 RepID=A0A8T1WL63_9STRA|nr:hypothetical protein PHYBOEH_004873 [Phytophthora boehmeriae]
MDAETSAIPVASDSSRTSATQSVSVLIPETDDASSSHSTDTSPTASGDAQALSEGSGDYTRQRIPRANYSVKKKRELIALAQVAGVREVCRMEGVPRRTLRHWLDDAEKINSFVGPDSRKSIGRSGRREILPFAKELSEFLEDAQRDGREMTSAHMIDFIRANYDQWLTTYMADKKSAESGHAALTRLCQRFVERHGFTSSGGNSSMQISANAGANQSSAGSSDEHDAVSSTNHAVKYESNGGTSPGTSSISRTSTTTIDLEDDSPLLFGLDIGTTAVKCVVVNGLTGQAVDVVNVSLNDVAVPASLATEARVGVQNVEQILLAVQRAVMMLHEAARGRITSVGICGQMHGILWWCSRGVHEAAERLLKRNEKDGDGDEEMLDPAWSELVTWQDQRCTPEFLTHCREKIAAVKATNNALPTTLAAGYGLATFAHTLEHSPRTLVGMDACGTIHDFVAFVLCGHTLPSETFMDTTDAHSWGGLNLQTQTWDPRILRGLQIPSSMLPSIKKPGTSVGRTCNGIASFGLPVGKPVYVPMGDHPSSVLAALAQRQGQPRDDANLTLVNIGTSAQMAIVLTGESVAKLSTTNSEDNAESADAESSSFEVRPFLFEDRYLGVAASLSGGNTFAWLVHQWQQWTQEMEVVPVHPDDDEEKVAQREAVVYERLIALGLQHEDTQLKFVPTLNGERADPNATGSIQKLRMNNWSMGDISAALSRGLVDNIFEMIPTELRPLVSSQTMIGTGNALVRNALLQRFLLKRLADPALLQIQSAADAAVGAALAPSLQ